MRMTGISGYSPTKWRSRPIPSRRGIRRSVITAATPEVNECTRLFAVARFKDMVTLPGEDGTEHLAKVELVIGEDDARTSSHSCRPMLLPQCGEIPTISDD